ncbi:hypothetical protein APR11_004759 [Nocardia amikacinitolerans]|nr:hypothetical protein [Nocardia amikacinitolerans]
MISKLNLFILLPISIDPGLGQAVLLLLALPMVALVVLLVAATIVALAAECERAERARLVLAALMTAFRASRRSSRSPADAVSRTAGSRRVTSERALPRGNGNMAVDSSRVKGALSGSQCHCRRSGPQMGSIVDAAERSQGGIRWCSRATARGGFGYPRRALAHGRPRRSGAESRQVLEHHGSDLPACSGNEQPNRAGGGDQNAAQKHPSYWPARTDEQPGGDCGWMDRTDLARRLPSPSQLVSCTGLLWHDQPVRCLDGLRPVCLNGGSVRKHWNLTLAS